MLLLYILAAISITHIIVDGKIFLRFREFFEIRFPNLFITEIITCHECCGYWIGTLLFFTYITQINIYNTFLIFFIYAPIISLLSDLTYRLKEFLCGDC